MRNWHVRWRRYQIQKSIAAPRLRLSAAGLECLNWGAPLDQLAAGVTRKLSHGEEWQKCEDE